MKKVISKKSGNNFEFVQFKPPDLPLVIRPNDEFKEGDLNFEEKIRRGENLKTFRSSRLSRKWNLSVRQVQQLRVKGKDTNEQTIRLQNSARVVHFFFLRNKYV